MQVANETQTAVSATLGAKETVAFEMVQDAAFFQMLSSNLYSNQRLAVVREVMCNAWDAHIESGITHVPIKVELTDEMDFIISDSGAGIPQDLIGKIYGTYGASTKKNDSRSTGGFGLGCKSPFALVDSFMVINECEGKKVIYNMTKSSVESNGLPSMTKIIEMPSNRTGLTVKLRVEQSDVAEIRKYVSYIAMHGEMYCEFNGEKQYVMNMSTIPGSYMVDKGWYNPYMGEHRVFVRYGAVIYPMLQTPGTERGVALLLDFMDMAGFGRIVVQAAPDTLALTPNREALSSQKMTEDGVANLCVDLVNRIEIDLRKMLPETFTRIEKGLSSGRRVEHFDKDIDWWNNIEPTHLGRYIRSGLCVTDREKQTVRMRIAEKAGFFMVYGTKNKKVNKQLWKLRKKLQSREMHRGSAYRNKKLAVNQFARKHIMQPLGRIAAKNSAFNPRRIYGLTPYYTHQFRIVKKELLENMIDGDIDNALWMVDNKTVFIGYLVRGAEKSAAQYPGIEYKGNYLFYKVENNDQAKDSIVKTFEDAGFTVVDLTLNHLWDQEAQQILAERKAKAAAKAVGKPIVKKSKNGLYSINNIYDAQGNHKRSVKTICSMTYANTTDNPLFYFEAKDLGKDGQLDLWHYNLLTDDEKENGIFVRNGIEKNMAEKRGAIKGSKYFARKLLDAVMSPEFKTYMTKTRLKSVWDQYGVDPDDVALIQELGVALPGFDKMVEDPKLELIKQLMDCASRSRIQMTLGTMTSEEVEAWYDAENMALIPTPFLIRLKAIFRDPIIECFVDHYSESPLLELVRNRPEYKPALKSLVLIAIKNGNKSW